MSTVVRFKNLRFMILAAEPKSETRPHVHVEGPGGSAKIWLDSFAVARSKGFSERALTEIVEQVERYAEALLAKWSEYHGQSEDPEA